MTTAEFPPVEEVVPHAGPMVLLTRVLEHENEHTVCEAEAGAHALAPDPGGAEPAWMGLEYMAQCVAAHAGLLGRASGEPPRVGFLLSVRRLEIRALYFRRGQRLVVSAHRVWGVTKGLVSFDCELRDGESGGLLVRGCINCFTPREGENPGAGT